MLNHSLPESHIFSTLSLHTVVYRDSGVKDRPPSTGGYWASVQTSSSGPVKVTAIFGAAGQSVSAHIFSRRMTS